MSNEISKIQNYELATTSGGQLKAVDIRREIATHDLVLEKLSKAEKKCYIASTKQLIKDIKDQNLFIKKISDDIKLIAIDIGLNNESIAELVYISTRISEYLSDYKPNLAYAEFKVAFNLLSVGELDLFIDDKKHYQSFSIQYVSNVLNAYEKFRGQTFKKARDIHGKLEEQKPKRSLEDARIDHNRTLDMIYECYSKFIKTPNIEFSTLQSMFIFDWMVRAEIAGELNILKDDTDAAYREYIQMGRIGRVSQYDLKKVIEKGVESIEIAGLANAIARQRIISEKFAEIRDKKTDLVKLLDYKK